MRPGERVNAKREIATVLSQSEWPDINLILSEHGLRTSSGYEQWNDDARYEYVIDMMSQATDEEIQELHQFVVGDGGGVSPERNPWRQGRLKLFASHLATEQEFVGTVRGAVARYGISCFVAHTSIEPSAEWQDMIEAALRTCDAMAVFLHKGFKQSDWCDQEVGFALARRVPVLPIAIDLLMPYGFMGKLQAAKCSNDSPAAGE